jgi:3-hydroxyisobutyrate dehydrogenase
MARIGFIGLGNMGLPMALNLVKAGHAVTGFDVAAASIAKLAAAGKEVREVYLDRDGVLAHAGAGALLIDSSTIDVETARAVTSAAAAKGLPMLDAPVSGGVTGAAAATLTFMVGGGADAFARAKPLLDAMGKTIVHAGASGSGQAAKICNNMMLAISMIGVSEGFLLADKLGLDRQKLFDISSKSSGQSWALTSYCPVPGLVPTSPANRDYQAGFTAAMMVKDLRLAQEAARAAGATTPLGAEAAALYGLFVAHGHGGLDFSGIIRFLRGN